MSALVTVATCNLNQWALDFDGNLDRILTSIREAKARGATYRVGPELEVCGYGCEDHFLEADTFFHCWESMETLLKSDVTNGILCDIGMPVMFNGVRYNCRVFCLNQKIIFVRPKMFFADDGHGRETRWFTTWKVNWDNREQMLQSLVLPKSIQKLTGQVHVPFGYGIVTTLDSSCTSETCEELFTPDSPHINLSLAGAEIIGNGSGSHHQLRKLNQRIDLVKGATTKSGGVYVYANQKGCDGGRLYYDGCSMIAVNGEIVGQASQFSVKDVEVVTATVDLDDVRSFRGSVSSRSEQASSLKFVVPTIHVDFNLCHDETELMLAPTTPFEPYRHLPEEETALGPACWLWDYLRRSGGSGFFLPLSGGPDSASVACLVGVMCHLVTEAANSGDEQVISDVQRILGTSGEEYKPMTANELASHVLHTTYMGSTDSPDLLKRRAASVANDIGSYHLGVGMCSMVDSFVTAFGVLTGKTPRFQSQGGDLRQDLALQNVRGRVRMVMSYMLAQLLPWVRSKDGFLLVLGSSNVDEALRGYVTKYDSSSGDLNPIGGMSKGDLKKLIKWAAVKYNYPTLAPLVEAPAPGQADYVKADEEDMGMSYDELGWFGRLRKIDRCGPYWMYRKLTHMWSHLTPTTVAEKVKRFFFYYSINRHKMTTLTPSYHAENYSPDDNRFDLRPFLYNSRWTRQFRSIDSLATRLEEKKNA